MKQYQSGLRGWVLGSEEVCYVVTDPGLSVNLSYMCLSNTIKNAGNNITLRPAKHQIYIYDLPS